MSSSSNNNHRSATKTSSKSASASAVLARSSTSALSDREHTRRKSSPPLNTMRGVSPEFNHQLVATSPQTVEIITPAMQTAVTDMKFGEEMKQLADRFHANRALTFCEKLRLKQQMKIAIRKAAENGQYTLFFEAKLFARDPDRQEYPPQFDDKDFIQSFAEELITITLDSKTMSPRGINGFHVRWDLSERHSQDDLLRQHREHRSIFKSAGSGCNSNDE